MQLKDQEREFVEGYKITIDGVIFNKSTGYVIVPREGGIRIKNSHFIKYWNFNKLFAHTWKDIPNLEEITKLKVTESLRRMIFIERDRYLHPEDWVDVSGFFMESFPDKFPGNQIIRDTIYIHRSGTVYNGNLGNTISIASKKFRCRGGGYTKIVNIWQRPISYPRLYLWAFGGKLPKDWRSRVVKHVNGNSSNNRLENLRW